MSCPVTQSGLTDSTFLKICAFPRIAESLHAVDVMEAWYSSNILLDVLVYYSSCTYEDWYDLYLLVPYSLALKLEIYILVHLLCGLLLDVIVTWNCHIYDLPPIRLLLLYDYVWFVAGDMSVSDYWGVPQYSCLLILHHLFSLMLIPALCFHSVCICPGATG